MPLRKRRARRCPKPICSLETKENISPDESEGSRDDEQNGVEPSTPSQWTEEISMDDEERKARETIAQLAKKYQVQLGNDEGSSETLDIIRLDDTSEITTEPHHNIETITTRDEDQEVREEEEEADQSYIAEELDEAEEVKREKVEEKKRGKENKRASRIAQKRQTRLQKLKQGSTPAFKRPKPLAHHSTPSQLQKDLFGFEELDSPLTLSPVRSTPAGRRSRSSSLSELSPEKEEKMTKPSPYSRIQGTYDIPFRRKTPRRQGAQRRKSMTSGEERWATQLNAQFNEVEQFELPVE